MSIKQYETAELPSVEYLRECFCVLGKDTLVWKVRPVSHFPSERYMKIFNTRFAGRIIQSGEITINKERYSFKRVLRALVHGEDNRIHLKRLVLETTRPTNGPMNLSGQFLDECFYIVNDELIWKVRPLEHFYDTRACNAFNARFAGKKAGSLLVAKSGKRQHSIRLAGIRYCYRRVKQVLESYLATKGDPDVS